MTSKLRSSGLTKRFKKLVARADSIWLASAWVTDSEALDALIRAKCDVRVVVGTHGNATDPRAIRSLIDGGVDVRIVDSEPLFHPKLFRFELGDERLVWIGSANFTGAGFGGNRELLLETNAFGIAKQAEAWFNGLWEGLSSDVEAVLERYAERRRKQGVDKQLGQLVEPSEKPAPRATRIRFEATEGRGASRYTGEMVIWAGGARRIVPYGSATAALCAVLEGLRHGHRGFLAACARDEAFAQRHRNGTTSQYLASERRRIKEHRARRGELGSKARDRILRTPITPIRLNGVGGEWWVSRDTSPKQVGKMIRAAAAIAGVDTGSNVGDPGF